MSTIGIPPLQAHTPLTAGNQVTPDAHRSLLQLYNASPLIPVSSASGAQRITVPYAKSNQAQERTYIKTSNDANVITLAASGTDKINGAAALAMAAAQFSKVKIKSDGVENWYVVG